MENVKLAIKGERLAAKIPYADGKGPKEAKKIAHYEWNKDGKFWSYPLEWRSATGLRRAAKSLGCDLEMSPGVRAWGKLEKEKREAEKAASEIENYDWIVKDSYPEIYKAITGRPFQAEGIQFGLKAEKYLLADDPGLGKTLQTIALMIEKKVTGPILVVANKSAQHISWPNEIRKWAPGDEVVVYEGAKIPATDRDRFLDNIFINYRQQPDRRTWVIVNPVWIRMKAELDDYGHFVYERGGAKIVQAKVPAFFQHNWSAIVADESHETLATNTLNAKKWSQQRQGLAALNTDGPKISISGSPMRGKPENMFGHLQWLYPEEYKGFWSWAKRHFEIGGSDYSDHVIGELIDEKAFYEEISNIMLRREKGEVAGDLPPKQYGGAPHPKGDVVGVWLPMEGEQKTQYEDFVDRQEIVSEEGETLDAIGILAIYTRLRQLSNTSATVGEKMVKVPELDADGNPRKTPEGKTVYLTNPDGSPMLMPEAVLVPKLPSNKFDWLVEWLTERDLLGKGAKGTGKVIIASQFRQTLDLFRTALQEKPYYCPSFAITGAASAAYRVKAQNEFQNNPDSPKLFFLQTDAGGTSLTLDMADDVIILDEKWDPDKQKQVEDRAHRLSRKHNVTIWYLRSFGTIEESIGVTVKERAETCSAILDGSRGVEIRKKILGR